MDNLQEKEQRIWEYIDGVSDTAEKNAVEKLIAENLEWRRLYQELLEVNTLVQDTELEAPSLRFSKNVMEEIAKLNIAPATKKYINNKIIWGIAIFFIASITGFLVYGIGQIDWSAAANTGSNWPVDFSNVDYSKMFNSSFMNIFMMVNVVLGLMLVDRYLNKKRKDFYTNH